MIQETIYSRHIEDLQGNQLDVQIFQPKKKPQSQELSQDMFSGMHRKCIGKLLPGKMIIYSCKADLTPHINFSNCFCIINLSFGLMLFDIICSPSIS